jgi:flagellar export protein FliJ
VARGLGALIRLHDWQVDEKRRALAEKLRIAEQLEAKLNDLEAEAVAEARVAASAPETALFYVRYLDGVRKRRTELNRAIAAIEVEIDAAREAVREAFLQLKKFQTAAERRDKREAQDRDRRDQGVLDEVALNTHRRKGG